MKERTMPEGQPSAKTIISTSPAKLILDTGPFLQIHSRVYSAPELQEAAELHNTANTLHSF